MIELNGHIFVWKDVRNGVKQGSVFKQFLFTILIDDIDVEVLCEIF